MKFFELFKGGAAEAEVPKEDILTEAKHLVGLERVELLKAISPAFLRLMHRCSDEYYVVDQRNAIVDIIEKTGAKEYEDVDPETVNTLLKERADKGEISKVDEDDKFSSQRQDKMVG